MNVRGVEKFTCEKINPEKLTSDEIRLIERLVCRDDFKALEKRERVKKDGKVFINLVAYVGENQCASILTELKFKGLRYNKFYVR